MSPIALVVWVVAANVREAIVVLCVLLAIVVWVAVLEWRHELHERR